MTTLRCSGNIGRHMHLELRDPSLPIRPPNQQPLFASIRVHSRFLPARLLTDVGQLNFGTANERESTRMAALAGVTHVLVMHLVGRLVWLTGALAPSRFHLSGTAQAVR